MGQYKSADRRAWVKYYEENGNVVATCANFGISRATFYKWLSRYDPTKPSKPLVSKSRMPHTPPKPKWQEQDLRILAQLAFHAGSHVGATKLAEQLRKVGIDLSRSTVGRMLHRIRKGCPLCPGMKDHNYYQHLYPRDPQTWQLGMDTTPEPANIWQPFQEAFKKLKED